MRQISYILLALTLTAVACGNIGKKKRANIVTTYTAAPAFDADSAFSFVKAQTDFGPRVPNTPAHKACAGWLENKLASFGATTIVQQFRTVTFDNTQLDCYNIIGQINPDNPVRIILCAHWDSRPWADNDPDPANRNTPIDGANDGASGVGVILEIARQLQIKAPAIGVDCIFFDAEDWGPGDDYTGDDGNYWGLGSQYWAANPHKEGSRARYAVLLDMVGGKGARFCLEGYSVMFAKNVVDKVWNTAAELGHGSLFMKVDGSFVTDDHYYINTIAKIPAIDIVPYLPIGNISSFGPTWHTLQDNIDNIDKDVLKAVGETVLKVIEKERP